AVHDFSFLTKLPLLRSESEREFEQLLSALRDEIQPHRVIEDMYVAEIAIIIWEILRLRRCKMTILNAAFRLAFRDLIDESAWQTVPLEDRTDLHFGFATLVIGLPTCLGPRVINVLDLEMGAEARPRSGIRRRDRLADRITVEERCCVLIKQS